MRPINGLLLEGTARPKGLAVHGACGLIGALYDLLETPCAQERRQEHEFYYEHRIPSHKIRKTTFIGK